jgi:hypothetical protein
VDVPFRSSSWFCFQLLVLLLILAHGFPTRESHAQPASAPTQADTADADSTILSADHRRATMAGWIQRQRLHVLDRSHSYGGWILNRDEYGFSSPLRSEEPIDPQSLELYDRGVFRHLTPDMDREYGLDMLAYRFTGRASSQWSHAPNGVRTYAGSIERTTGAVVTELKQSVSLGDDHQLDVHADLQQDASGRRALLTLGYRWQVSENHMVGARHTFAEYKPDLDATLFYQFERERLGTARIDVTFQNLYNDFLYNTLGVPAQDERLLRTYGTRPFLLSATLTSPARYRLRGEVHGSVQPQSEMTFTAQNTPDFRFQEDESLYFLSGMAEYQFPYVTVGAFYRRDMNRRHRYGSSGEVQADYTATQSTETVGAFFLADWWKLKGEVWGMYTQYRDHQTGQHFGLSTIDGPIDYRDPHRRLKIRVLHEPNSTGPIFGLEYLFFQRPNLKSGRRMTRQWTGQWFVFGRNNYRLAPLLGYAFEHGSVTFGVGYDLDNDNLPSGIPDSPGRFDNGFGRLTIYW